MKKSVFVVTEVLPQRVRVECPISFLAKLESITHKKWRFPLSIYPFRISPSQCYAKL
ncbi:hypothetical protein M7I_0561 [Glarea lozoyensis 74030]|uniref:Uncharacterized protein n=1 Tax=Glarea lozoyensis (strain ATCC 74030 / MF5533) TaxID=1104152 RepID=H0EDV2_GLAL7|nr:hypothetical protein M7I_0561 [Glarea lozoyensis 74030]